MLDTSLHVPVLPLTREVFRGLVYLDGYVEDIAYLGSSCGVALYVQDPDRLYTHPTLFRNFRIHSSHFRHVTLRLNPEGMIEMRSGDEIVASAPVARTRTVAVDAYLMFLDMIQDQHQCREESCKRTRGHSLTPHESLLVADTSDGGMIVKEGTLRCMCASCYEKRSTQGDFVDKNGHPTLFIAFDGRDLPHELPQMILWDQSLS